LFIFHTASNHLFVSHTLLQTATLLSYFGNNFFTHFQVDAIHLATPFQAAPASLAHSETQAKSHIAEAAHTAHCKAGLS